MKVDQIAAQQCPVCRHTISACTNTAREKPAPVAGDYLICASCTSVLQLDQDLKLRAVPAAEIPKPLRYPIGKVRFNAQLARAARN